MSATTGAADDVTSYGLVQVRRRGRVAELMLDRPDSLNALSTTLATDLRRAAEAVATTAGVSAMVLSSSAERAFCVGADLKERAGFGEADLFEQRPLFRGAFAAVFDLPMPAVAAVSGFALGGGLELALSCDIVVADRTAVLGLPEVGVGLIPGCGGTQLTARRTGSGRAAELLFTGRRVDAGEALRIGLIDHLAESASARVAALELAERIAANAPLALRAAKRALRIGLADGLAAGVAAEDDGWNTVIPSVDRREGIAAFAEKRQPVWRGDSDMGGQRTASRGVDDD